MTKSILPSLICLIFCGFSIVAPSAEGKPPNIVLILSDDQSYTDYSFMGHEHIETPHLDQLASESALFKRGYVPTALCRPALMTIATGLYSHQNGITGNDPDNTPENAAHAEKAGKSAEELLISNVDKTGTIAKWLGEAGYVSHQSGKWWEGSYQRGGFTEGMTRGYPDKGGRHGDDGLKIGREGMDPVFDFIDRSVADEKPFFVWYAPFLPHTPHDPSKELADKYVAKGVNERVAKYYANVERLDDTVGLMMEKLDDAGVAENTLVIYVTDNGWIQTETGSYAERSKRSPNEGGTRNPIMFRWPGTIPAADRPELSTSLDIVPTILAAAGAEAPHDFPGLNLLSELKSGDAIDRDTIYGESFAHDIADIENPQASLLYRWVIKGHDKLLLTYDGAPGKMKYPPSGGEAQLYDLKKDPNEATNLAANQPEKVEALSALLEEWYIPEQRQAGKVTEVAPKERNPARKNKGKAKGNPPGKGKGAAAKKQAAAPGKSTSQPNILWFVVDDMSANFSCYGETAIQTPHVDGLVREGLRFTRAYATSPVCSTFRSAMITGMYQTSIGAHHHRSGRSKENRIVLPPGVRAIPEIFREAGYYTCMGSGLPGVDSSGNPTKTEDRQGKADYNFEWNPETLYDSPDWAGRNPDQPFFMQVQLHGGKIRGASAARYEQTEKRMEADFGGATDPESVKDGLPPYYPRDPVMLRDWATYLDSVRITDDHVGRVIDRLKKEGLLESTLVIFFTDHGISHARGKQFLYDEGTHIPLVVRGPGIPAGETRTDLVEHIDIAALSLAAAGIEIPEKMEGDDILAAGYEPKEAVFAARDRCGEAADRIRSVRTDRYLYIRNFYPERPLLMPSGYKDSKLILKRLWQLHDERELSELSETLLFSPTRPPEELYLYGEDPWQIKNLADDHEHAEALKAHRARLEKWIAETGDPGPETREVYVIETEDQMKSTRNLEAREIYRKNAELYQRWAQEGK